MLLHISGRAGSRLCRLQHDVTAALIQLTATATTIGPPATEADSLNRSFVTCSKAARRALRGQLVAKLRHHQRVGHDDWVIDLALGTSAGPVIPPEVGQPIRFAPPAIIQVAIELQSIFIEHGKARKNRLRDFNTFHGYAHSYDPKTIAGAFLVVNAAEYFYSPLRRPEDITRHSRPKVSAREVAAESVKTVSGHSLTQRRPGSARLRSHCGAIHELKDIFKLVPAGRTAANIHEDQSTIALEPKRERRTHDHKVGVAKLLRLVVAALGTSQLFNTNEKAGAISARAIMTLSRLDESSAIGARNEALASQVLQLASEVAAGPHVVQRRRQKVIITSRGHAIEKLLIRHPTLSLSPGPGRFRNVEATGTESLSKLHVLGIVAQNGRPLGRYFPCGIKSCTSPSLPFL